MRLHFANSATVRVPGRLVSSARGFATIDLNVRYGILEHPRFGPILIDAGYSDRITRAKGRSLPLRLYAGLLRPKLSAKGHPAEVLKTLGYAPQDVRHIVLTHLHADHVGHLDLFPHADIHLGATCASWLHSDKRYAALRKGIFQELLPKPGRARLKFFETGTPVETTFGQGSSFDILGDGSMIAIALPGHSEGHFGIFFPQLQTPLLYAVDTSWTLDALARKGGKAVPARLVCADRTHARVSEIAVQDLISKGASVALCHDPDPFAHDLPATFAEARNAALH